MLLTEFDTGETSDILGEVKSLVDVVRMAELLRKHLVSKRLCLCFRFGLEPFPQTFPCLLHVVLQVHSQMV